MTAVLGFGGYVPDRIMTNDDWAALVDTTDEWITTRTGIKERRFAADDQSTLDLAERAALRAMTDAGLTADDIDEIVLATDTPELYTPDTASLLQDRLGCRYVPTYDLGGSGCAGWIQAIDVARARIAFEPKNVLVVGVELISRLISWEDRATCVLFGDGAGAVVMGPGEGKATLIDVISGTDGSKADILTLQTGGTRHPFTVESAAAGDHQRLEMKGSQVFREAVRRMSSVTLELLERDRPAPLRRGAPHPPSGQQADHRRGWAQARHRRRQGVRQRRPLRQYRLGHRAPRPVGGVRGGPHPAGRSRHADRLRCRIPLGLGGDAVLGGSTPPRTATPSRGRDATRQGCGEGEVPTNGAAA